ncbi:MAG: hypothetical protein ACHREM_23345, partial [Polyangiales bacterium]
MRTRLLASSFTTALLFVVCGGAMSCGGTVDSSGLGADDTSTGDGAVGADSGGDATIDSTTSADSSGSDTRTTDSATADTGVTDTATSDTTTTDTGATDTATSDTAAADTTAADTTTADTATADTTTADTATADTATADTATADTATADTGAADTATTDTATDAGGVTLLNVCSQFADALCGSQLETCCGTHGVAWSASGCHTNTLFMCNSWVDRVNAGTSTFDSTAFATCVAGWQAAESSCDLPTQDFAHDYAPCDQLFNGKTSPGSACTSDSDCHAEPGTFAACETVAGKQICIDNAFPGTGGSCTFTGNNRGICLDGDYCPGFGGSP